MKKLAISLLPVLLLITSPSHGLKVYKWRDSEGVKYSDRLPPSMAEDPTQVRINSDANGKESIEPRTQTVLGNTETLNGETTAAANGAVVHNALQASGSGSPIGGGGGGGGGGGIGSQTNSDGGDVGELSAGSESDISPPARSPLSSGGGDKVAAATVSAKSGNASANESGFGGLAVGAVGTGNTSAGSSAGSGQGTINVGQVAVSSGDKPSTQDQNAIKSPAPPESGSDDAGSTSELVEVATIETLTTTNNRPSAPEPQSESEPKEAAQVETIVVAGSGSIPSPAPAPFAGSSPTGASKYYNSDEPGCDGTDSTVLFCDDFEDGGWARTNCAANGWDTSSDNDGWCANAFIDWPDPEGTDWARCGGAGVAGTNCAGTSEEIPPTPGGRMQARHYFAPNNNQYDEIYARWYIKELPGFVKGHEKMMRLFGRGAPSKYQIGMLFKPFGGSCPSWLSIQEDKWLPQNQGNKICMTAGRWYYIEVHIKLNDLGKSNAEYRLWMDDCGTSGLDCTGPGTLRAEHTGREFRTPGKTGSIGEFSLENWGNPSSTGEQYYDQFYVATRRIGPM